ncbi:hypothetical protein BLNAU_23638 [Blattamonas nauphoetae]|uniref:Uncharacterized protein n=1 Tax=Blattamonas nauphoetae TaxID=2049346 RepID=A0ABQ9WPQ8_9EUKA|nr:hypothetical protein BLNAU_23638 [Blattamonas nauphoetae]
MTVATESDADDHEWELSADGSRADKDEGRNSNKTTLAMTFIHKEGEVDYIPQFAAILTDRTRVKAKTRHTSAKDEPLLSMTFTRGVKVRQAQTTYDNDVGPRRNQIDLSASMPPGTNTTQISTLYPSHFPILIHSGSFPSTITVGGGTHCK